MRRLIGTGAALATVLAVAACGSSSGGGGGGSSGAAGTSTVSVKQVQGLGRVLVDQDGMALYSPEQEMSGKVLCTAGCTSFWKPLTIGSGSPTGSGTSKLGVVKRPDGTRQVTSGGKPLYTFVQDSPGKVTGNGFEDAFGGQHFTWHAALAGGKAASGGSSSSSSGSGSGGSGGSGGGSNANPYAY